MNEESKTEGTPASRPRVPKRHERIVAAEHDRATRRRLWIEAAAVVAFWSVLASLEVAREALDPRGGGGGDLRPGETLYVFLEHGLWAFATPFIFWLVCRFGLDGRRWVRHLLLHVAAAVTVSATLDLAGDGLWNAFVDGSPRTVSLGAVFVGFHILPELLLYLVVLAAGLARDYFLRYRERVEESARLRAEAAELHAHTSGLQAQLAESRLRALRMQINPHFLFNTLNTISSYLERDPAGVRRLIARLSELLRYTLEKADVREVPLRKELEFIDRYLEIQQIRFEDRLQVRHDVDPTVLDALVPNLILQPLVENAVKHGIGGREHGGRVELRSWREGEHLHLCVCDDGPGLGCAGDVDAATTSQGIGLQNTRKRLESMYGRDQRFALEGADGGGLVAHIILPFHTETDLYISAVEENPADAASWDAAKENGADRPETAVRT